MDRIAIIRTEAQRLAGVLAVTDPDARCPTCPDWSATDLLWHLTMVHFFWAGALERKRPHRIGHLGRRAGEARPPQRHA